MFHSSRRIALTLGALACSSLSLLEWDGARPTRAAAQSEPSANVIRDIPYAKAADPESARRQTLDL